jgi:hypothetical protein
MNLLDDICHPSPSAIISSVTQRHTDSAALCCRQGFTPATAIALNTTAWSCC